MVITKYYILLKNTIINVTYNYYSLYSIGLFINLTILKIYLLKENKNIIKKL